MEETVRNPIHKIERIQQYEFEIMKCHTTKSSGRHQDFPTPNEAFDLCELHIGNEEFVLFHDFRCKIFYLNASSNVVDLIELQDNSFKIVSFAITYLAGQSDESNRYSKSKIPKMGFSNFNFYIAILTTIEGIRTKLAIYDLIYQEKKIPKFSLQGEIFSKFFDSRSFRFPWTTPYLAWDSKCNLYCLPTRTDHIYKISIKQMSAKLGGQIEIPNSKTGWCMSVAEESGEVLIFLSHGLSLEVYKFGRGRKLISKGNEIKTTKKIIHLKWIAWWKRLFVVHDDGTLEVWVFSDFKDAPRVETFVNTIKYCAIWSICERGSSPGEYYVFDSNHSSVAKIHIDHMGIQGFFLSLNRKFLLFL